MTVADIQAIPDDKWTASHGGCSKPGNAIVADTVTNLRWTTGILKGESSDAYNHMGDTISEFADKNAAIVAFQEATAAFSEALKNASDETLNSVVTAPWQAQVPVMILAQISVSHVWYHDGQLNYIQTLLGDGEVHWQM